MAHTKPALIVIAGPNGSGKTTATRVLCSKYPHWTKGLVEINPDTIAQEKFGNWNDPVAIRGAAQYSDQIREQCLQDHQSLLFETVLSTPEKIDFIRRAKEAGFFIRFVYVATSNPEINMLRVAWRVDQGGHTVPEDKIRARYKRSIALALDAAQLADRAYFVDNSKDYNEDSSSNQLQPLFRMIDGAIVKVYLKEENFPDWIKPIYSKALKQL